MISAWPAFLASNAASVTPRAAVAAGSTMGYMTDVSRDSGCDQLFIPLPACRTYQFLAGNPGNEVTYGMHLRTGNAPAVVRVTRDDKIACQCLDSLPRSRPPSCSPLAAERRPPLSPRRRPSQAVWREG